MNRYRLRSPVTHHSVGQPRAVHTHEHARSRHSAHSIGKRYCAKVDRRALSARLSARLKQLSAMHDAPAVGDPSPPWRSPLD